MTFWEESLQRHEISFLLSIFQEEKREEVKEWVLAVSMDQKVEFKDFSLSLAYLYHVIKIRPCDWLHPRVTPLPTPPLTTVDNLGEKLLVISSRRFFLFTFICALHLCEWITHCYQQKQKLVKEELAISLQMELKLVAFQFVKDIKQKLK